MKFFVHITFFLICANSFAQEIVVQKFFNDFFNHKTEKIIYSESNLDIEEIKSSLNQAFLVTKMQLKESPEILIDSLTFSQHELDYVFNEIERFKNKLWAKDLIANAKYVSRKEIDKIFKDKPKKGWNYFHRNYGENLITFSKPVFIRDNTICFIYSSNSCGGLCGTGSFDIYIKQHGKWIFFNSLYSWIS